MILGVQNLHDQAKGQQHVQEQLVPAAACRRGRHACPEAVCSAPPPCRSTTEGATLAALRRLRPSDGPRSSRRPRCVRGGGRRGCSVTAGAPAPAPACACPSRGRPASAHPAGPAALPTHPCHLTQHHSRPCSRQVRELVDQHTWEEHCVGHAADAELDVGEVAPRQLCLLAFLPHILDSKAAGREAYLEVGAGPIDCLPLKGCVPWPASRAGAERHPRGTQVLSSAAPHTPASQKAPCLRLNRPAGWPL